jgi:hypothetical protein
MTANVLYRIEQPGSNNDNKYIFEGSVETGDGQDLKKVYLTASIQGGVYEDNVVLQDATVYIPLYPATLIPVITTL